MNCGPKKESGSNTLIRLLACQMSGRLHAASDALSHVSRLIIFQETEVCHGHRHCAGGTTTLILSKESNIKFVFQTLEPYPPSP